MVHIVSKGHGELCYLFVLLAGLLDAISACGMTHRIDEAFIQVRIYTVHERFFTSFKMSSRLRLHGHFNLQ